MHSNYFLICFLFMSSVYAKKTRLEEFVTLINNNFFVGFVCFFFWSALLFLLVAVFWSLCC